MDQGSSKELVKTHENAKIGKWPKESKESKWAKDAQRNQKVQMTILSHWRKNKQQTQRGLVGLGQITPQQEWQSSTAGHAKIAEKRAKKWTEGGKAHGQTKA